MESLVASLPVISKSCHALNLTGGAAFDRADGRPLMSRVQQGLKESHTFGWRTLWLSRVRSSVIIGSPGPDARPLSPLERKWRLLGEDDPDSSPVLFGFGLDTDYTASQAKRSVRGSPDSGIIELDLQFGLQSWTMIQVDQRAVQAQIADNRLFLKRHPRVGEASHHGPEMGVAAQAFADGGNQDIQIRAA